MSQTQAAWTVRRLLEWTSPFLNSKGIESPRLCAELLLSHVLAISRIKLYTDYEKVVGERELKAYRDLVRRAAADEPVAYLTGKAHFFSLEFDVTRDVLIPRPDTETLVENVIQLIRRTSGMESPRVLDLCTGSGCIAAAIAQNVKTAVILATDISPAAVEIARANLQRLGLAERVTVQQGDLFDAMQHVVDRQPFNLIVANPPYIASGQIPTLEKSVRDFEPMLALDGGLDGLTVFRRILDEAPGRLVSGGHIFIEIAFDQGELALKIAQQHAEYTDAKILRDHASHDRVLTAHRK